jgi:hypothetical protein
VKWQFAVVPANPCPHPGSNQCEQLSIIHSGSLSLVALMHNF